MTPPPAALPKFWFGAPPDLEPGEEWVAHRPANRTQHKRAVGGGLHFTNRRVLFSPNLFDAALAGLPWQCALSDLSAVGVEPPRFALSEIFSGGLRSRLRLDLADGSHQLFVISKVAVVAEELSALIAEPSAGQGEAP